MRKHLLIYLAAVVPLAAWVPFSYASGTAVARETLTVGDTAVGFTPANLHQSSGSFIDQDCTAVLIDVETNSIRCTEDGTTPTSGATGKGYLLTPGSRRIIAGVTNIRQFLAIDALTGAPAKVEAVEYYGGEPYSP